MADIIFANRPAISSISDNTNFYGDNGAADGPVNYATIKAQLRQDIYLKTGTFPPNANATMETISVAGVTSGMFVDAYVEVSGANGNLYISRRKAVTDGIEFEYSTNPGAGALIRYRVY